MTVHKGSKSAFVKTGLLEARFRPIGPRRVQIFGRHPSEKYDSEPYSVPCNQLFTHGKSLV